MDELSTNETKVGASEVTPRVTQKLDPTTKHVLGREVGGYLIQAELGRGGMAMVYKAHDKALDRTVAIKVLPQHLLHEDEEFATRFEREAKAAARLDHPNVVQIYAAGRQDDILYIAMQYVQGSPLSDVMRNRRIGQRESVDLVRQTALALDAAHRMGIVHRDIKPSNIMLDAEGKVKVMDFGLAKAGRSGSAITRTGTYLGTPEYSSPEQCETRDVDGRSDIYSLGVVLYEMLSGTLPHVAETPLALFKKITEERPIPIQDLNRSVPKSVRSLLARMIEKDPARRFQSAADVGAACERILRTEKLPDTGPGGIPTRDLPVISGRIPPGRKRQSRAVAAFAGGALACAGLFLAGMTLFQPPAQTPPPDPIAFQPSGGGSTDRPVATVVGGQVVVFDFKNMNEGASNAQEVEWLEIGITEMLIANLSQAGGVTVMLRDDLVHEMHGLLKKKVSLGGDGQRVTLNEETRAFVVKLNARWLLTGKFAAQQSNLTIIASLYRMQEDGKLAPSGSFTANGNVNDVFALVDQLSASVLKKLAPAESTASAPPKPYSPALDEFASTSPYAPSAEPSPQAAQSKSYALNRFGRTEDLPAVRKALDELGLVNEERARRGLLPGRVGKDKDALERKFKEELEKRALGVAPDTVSGSAANHAEVDLRQAEVLEDALAKKMRADRRKSGADKDSKHDDKSKSKRELAASDPVNTEGGDAKPDAGLAGHGIDQDESQDGSSAGSDGGGSTAGGLSGAAGSSPKGGVAGTDGTLDEVMDAGIEGVAGAKIQKQHKNGTLSDDASPEKSPAGQVCLTIEVQEDAEQESILKSQVALNSDLTRSDVKLRVLHKQLEGKLAQIFAQVQAQCAPLQDPQGAGAGDEKLQRFMIYCQVKKHLEDLTPEDAAAIHENGLRLVQILHQEPDLQDALGNIQSLIDQIQPKAGTGTTPAK